MEICGPLEVTAVTVKTIPVSVGVVEEEELFKSFPQRTSKITSQTTRFTRVGGTECRTAKMGRKKLLVSAYRIFIKLEVERTSNCNLSAPMLFLFRPRSWSKPLNSRGNPFKGDAWYNHAFVNPTFADQVLV